MGEVLEKLQLDHLNPEKKKMMKKKSLQGLSWFILSAKR
jgi:hypothetical protein